MQELHVKSLLPVTHTAFGNERSQTAPQRYIATSDGGGSMYSAKSKDLTANSQTRSIAANAATENKILRAFIIQPPPFRPCAVSTRP